MNDPWIYLSAFGLLASAGLLVYLIRQLSGVEDTHDDEDFQEEHAVPQENLEEEFQAAQAVADLMQRSLPSETEPAPLRSEQAPVPQEPAPSSETPYVESVPRESERSKSDLSPAVAYLKALNDDIHTFHSELQGLKTQFDQFAQRQDKQFAELAQLLERMSGGEKGPSQLTKGTSEGESDK